MFVRPQLRPERPAAGGRNGWWEPSNCTLQPETRAPAAKQGQFLVPQRARMDLHLQPVKRTPHAALQLQNFSQKLPASRQLRTHPQAQRSGAVCVRNRV